MSAVERRFDEETGRWLLRAADRDAVTPFTEIAPGVWTADDAEGVPAECLVAEDAAAQVPAGVRERIEAVLGWIPDQGTGSAVVPSVGMTDLPATAVIHEPGIPYVHRDGSVLVPTESGNVKVRLSDSVLMIDVPVQSSHEWVRISDADTGTVLALGRVQRFGDGFGANVTFALDGSDIHIALTDTPLDPVADRRTRRSQWLDDVLAGLGHQWWRHPWRTRDTARDAVSVARSLGDSVREARARRFARIVPVAFGGAVAVAVAALSAVLVPLFGGGPAELRVAGATSAVYDFGDGGSLTVSAGINEDGTVGLVVSDAIVGSRRFGPLAGAGTDATPSYRAACRASKNLWVEEGSVPAVTSKYAVSLRADGGGSVLLGTVEMSSEANSFSSVDESCDSAPAANDGSITADVVYLRSTEEFSLPRPTGPLDGADEWSLAVEKVAPGPDALTGRSSAPVVFRTSE
jgi:hypothetical protein